MTWRFSKNNRTPLVYSDQILNSDSRQELNEILFGPKCLPWVDVKGPFVLKNDCTYYVPFSLTQAQKNHFISFCIMCRALLAIFCISHSCSNKRSHGPNLSSLYPFFFEDSKIVQTVRRKLVGVCVFCIFVCGGVAGEG